MKTIDDPEERVLTYCSDFLERLSDIGYGDFLDTNPKPSVELLCTKLEPTSLKREVRRSH